MILATFRQSGKQHGSERAKEGGLTAVDRATVVAKYKRYCIKCTHIMVGSMVCQQCPPIRHVEGNIVKCLLLVEFNFPLGI